MSARTLFEHRILSVVGFPVQTSAGARDYVRLCMSDWVNAVAITAEGAVVLVRQHRWGIDAPTLEVPGGEVDAGEDPARAARRELLEETGYAGGALRSMGWVWSNPAIQDNRTWMFHIAGVSAVAEPVRGPGEEDLEVVAVPQGEIPRMLAEGAINHALAVVSLQRYLLGQRGAGGAPLSEFEK